jgi:hypothetical protein
MRTKGMNSKGAFGGKIKSLSRSRLKSIMPTALKNFDNQMGKYKRKHWEYFKEWMGWETQENKEENNT